MLFQNWLKTLAVDFAGHSSRRDRRKTRSVSGHVVVTREVLVLPMLETLETKILLSADPVVIDIASGADGSNPVELANVNGTLFFSATEGINGIELWRSDGTQAGTILVKDIRTGGSAYVPAQNYSSNPRSLTNVNGTLFFGASDGTNGRELWKSDGTEAGTTLFKDIHSGPFSSYLSSLTNVNGTLFFSATDGTSGQELWKSDGTAAGTILVKDINAGNSGNNYPVLTGLTNVNGTLFFRANDGTNGYELWKSDGTEAGTTLVKDILTGGSSSNPSSLANLNGMLFFNADDGTNGTELWKSDGTANGTILVKDILTGGSSNPRSLTNGNGTLFFNANDGTNGDELWRSDGTSTGTTLVKDIFTGSNGSIPEFLTNVNGTLYFKATDNSNGSELWQSDGTATGTTLVKDINLGSYSSTPSHLTNVSGTLFFSAFNFDYGLELWSMPVNSPPQLTAFAAAVDTTNEDSQVELTFAEFLAQGDESDTDGTVDAFIVQTVTNGTLKIGTSAGNATAFAVGSNDKIDATHNAYWTPTANSHGNAIAALTVLAQDNVGDNSFLPVTAAVNVAGAADTPSVSNASTFANVQTTSGLVVSRNAMDGAEVTHFKITSITGGLLFQSNGTTAISSGAFITFAQANAGLKFTPALNSTATGHFTVQASTSNNDAGLGGSTITADISVNLPAPTITGPTPVTTAQRPTITWNSVSGANQYVVYLKNLSTGIDPVLVKSATGTSFTPTSDLGIGSYEVRVRALSASGDSSAYSQKLSFRISTPAVFGNVVIFQGTSKPTLSWNPLTGAVKFDLRIDNLSTGQQQVVRDTNLTATTWTSPTSLPMGKYRAWVRGTDASGSKADWSTAVNFFVLPPVSVVSPVNPTFDQTPTFTWNAVPGAVSYDLYYRNFSTGAATVAQTGIVGTTFTPATNLPTGSYQWHVLAVTQDGYRSQSATVKTFYVGGQPTVLTPHGSTLDKTPTFTWTPVTGAATYELWVNRIDVATNKIVYQTGLATASFTPLTALPVGTFRIWVRAISTTAQASLWSQPIDFTITAVIDEPFTAPGSSLLTHLTLLDDAALQISEQPLSAADDAIIPAETNGDHVSEVDSKFNLEVTEQLPHGADVAAYGSHGISRSSMLAPLIDIDETAVDELMADITTMKLLLQI